MANRDTPHGFRFAYTLHGRPPHLSKHRCDGTNGVYVGDLVNWGTTVGVAPASTGDDIQNNLVMGVAANYSASGSTDHVWVYDDLKNTVFMAQVDSSDITFDSSYFNQRYATTWVAGSTITGLSAMEIDTGSTDGRARILELVDMPNNSTAGAHQEVYCTIMPSVGIEIYGGATTV